MKISFSKKKKSKKIISFVSKKFSPKKLNFLNSNPLEKTKTKVNEIYKNYKKTKEREKIKREKQIKLDQKRQILEEEKRAKKEKIDRIKEEKRKVLQQKKLVLENEKLKESENQKKLQKHAEKMQEKINKHFEKWKNKVVMKFNRPSDGKLGIAEDQNSNINNLNGSLSVGDEIEALTDLAFNFAKDLKNKGQNLESKNKNKNSLKEKENENKKAKKVNGSGNNKSSGGTKFKVEYQNNGDQNPRAKFDSENNIVFINLEHPQVLKLINDVGKNNDYTKDPMFRKISDEIAFTEYAFGLANLLYQKKYYAENTDEYLREARSIINELSNIY